MKSSYRLVAKVNDFLDKVNVNDLTLDEDRINQMIEYRDLMSMQGFDTPFSPSFSLKNLAKELDTDILNDIKKQIEIMKYEGYLKKMTLKRMQVAIASHELLKSNINEEVKRNLPFKGDYLDIMTKLPHAMVDVYTTIKSWLEGETTESIIIKFKHNKEGKEKLESLRLYAIKDNIEEKIKRDFGEDAEIISTKVMKNKGLITHHAIKIALATAITKTAFEKTKDKLDIRSEKLRQYNKILNKHGFVDGTIVNSDEKFEKVIHELKNKGLIKESEIIINHRNPLMENQNQFTIDRDIIKEINYRNRILKTHAKAIAKRECALPIIRHYILNSTTQRKKDSNIPSLTINPTEEQLLIIKKYGKTIGINKLHETIINKIETENKNIDPEQYGIGYMAIKHDINKVSQLLGLSIDQINKSKNLVESLTKGRGSEFIGHLS